MFSVFLHVQLNLSSFALTDYGKRQTETEPAGSAEYGSYGSYGGSYGSYPASWDQYGGHCHGTHASDSPSGGKYESSFANIHGVFNKLCLRYEGVKLEI